MEYSACGKIENPGAATTASWAVPIIELAGPNSRKDSSDNKSEQGPRRSAAPEFPVVIAESEWNGREVGRVLSANAITLHDRINQAAEPAYLDELARLMWRSYGEAAISEADATFLDECIRHRRPLGHSTAPGFHKSIGSLAGRIGLRFKPRRPQRSPDREASRNRRRMLGGSSALPPTIRQHYSEGERAVLCVMAAEVKRQGVCNWPIDKIAALAGVCRTTAKNALWEARQLGHIKITVREVRGRKNLPNLVSILSVEWLTWMKRGPSNAHLIGVKMITPTKSIDIRKEEAFRKRNGKRDHGPPQRPPERPLVMPSYSP
jgi:hypothetical protein